MTEQFATGPREWRNFGLLFTVVFLALAGFLYWKDVALWWAGGIVALLCALAGVLAPRILRVPHALWMRFAMLLGWLNTRILLTLFFILVITPVGMVMRLLRHDPLARRCDRGAASYWEAREDRKGDRSRFDHLF